MITQFLYRLKRVLPEWVEARQNNVRQDRGWTLDQLIASLFNHVGGDKKEPAKVYLARGKKDDSQKPQKPPQQPQAPSKPSSNPGRGKIQNTKPSGNGKPPNSSGYKHDKS